MDQDKKSGYQTLLTSMLLSSPGPLVLGLASLLVTAPHNFPTSPGERQSSWRSSSPSPCTR